MIFKRFSSNMEYKDIVRIKKIEQMNTIYYIII